MKGVSAVIATILLLLIVIAIVGFAFGFFQRFFGIATSQGTNQLQNIQQQVDYAVRIETVSGTPPVTVLVRNMGTQSLNSTALGFFVDSAAATCGSWSGSGYVGSVIVSNGVAQCTISSPAGGCTSGKTLLITTPGMPASYAC